MLACDRQKMTNETVRDGTSIPSSRGRQFICSSKTPQEDGTQYHHRQRLLPRQMTKVPLLILACAISALAETAIPISESLEVLVLERGQKSAYKAACPAML